MRDFDVANALDKEADWIKRRLEVIVTTK